APVVDCDDDDVLGGFQLSRGAGLKVLHTVFDVPKHRGAAEEQDHDGNQGVNAEAPENAFIPAGWWFLHFWCNSPCFGRV
ncbi:MAG: hypothetical protein ACI9TH_001801, partial [Kiritimatiellia bacterium]